MRIKIGEVQLELDPDYSAQDVEKAKDEVARWKATYESLWATYVKLAGMVMNAENGNSVHDSVSGVDNLPPDWFVRKLELLARERDQLRQEQKKYHEVCRAAHPNAGASHAAVVEHLNRIGASKQQSVSDRQGRGRRKSTRRPRTGS